MKLIIGCGNTDRGDDGAGILVARRLRALGLNAVEHEGDGLSLIELWHGFDDVIVVDAMLSGGTPGTIFRWDPLSQPRCTGQWRSSTHSFGPAEAIELARVIGRLPDRLTIFGIEARKFDPGGEVSREVMAAIECVECEIASEVASPLRPTLAAAQDTNAS